MLETEVENMGAHLNAFTSREMTVYYMQVFKKNVPNAMDILSDMLLNSKYDHAMLEAEKDTILQELEEVNKDSMEILLENVYNNAYPEHMMGQPILGDRGNIKSVTRDMVTHFHAANYFGSNIIVVGTGDVQHENIVELTKEFFGKLNKVPPQGVVRKGLNKPIYTPQLTMHRDDEMDNACVGIFYNAPSWKHQDYYSFLLLERLFGTYTAESNMDQLKDIEMQNNSLHAFLAKYPEIQKQQAIYSPYEDCGLFGNYFIGSETVAKQMNYAGLFFPTKFANHIDEFELERAKQKLYMDLANIESTADVMQSLGQQALYMNRPVPRAEVAARIANITKSDLEQICNDWFYDAVFLIFLELYIK